MFDIGWGSVHLQNGGSIMGGGFRMHRSTYLFATPTWAEGVGRLLDFGDSLTQYNDSPTPEEADSRALATDWRSVGGDILGACAQFVGERDRSA
jgi:hypothetical protein